MPDKWITIKLIKIFIIIGIIISPIIIAILLFFYDKFSAFIALGEYFITVPLGIYSLNKVEKATHKSQVIFVAILDIIILSVIPGLLIILSSSKIYHKEKLNGDFDYSKALEHDTIIDYKEDGDDNEW